MNWEARLTTIGGSCLATLAGLAVGVFLGSNLEVRASDSPPEPEVAEPPPEPAVTTGDLERVVLELRDVSARIDVLSKAVSRPVVREVVPPAQGQADDSTGVGVEPTRVDPVPSALLAWMERMEERMALTGSIVAPDAIRVPGPGYVPTPPPPPPLDDSQGGAFSRSHFFWTFQDVLDVYGLPALVHTDGGAVEWEYEYTDANTPEGFDDVHFVFSGGLCVNLYAH